MPLFIFWSSETSLKRVIIAGWLTQFTLTLLGFNWVAHTIHEFGHMAWPISIAGLFAFCSFANIDVVIAGFLQHLLIKWISQIRSKHASNTLSTELSPLGRIAIMALLMALVKGSFDTIFHWSYGYPLLWVHLPMAQLAELIGFQGLSSLVILANIGSFQFWQHRHSQAGRKMLGTLLVLFVLANLAGYGLKRSWPAANAELNVLITQANIGNLEKAQAEKGLGFQQFITDKYSTLTRNAKFSADQEKIRVDFALWPETAFPYRVDQRWWLKTPNYPFITEPIRNLAKELEIALITGGYGTSPVDGEIANTLFVIEKSGVIQPDPYFKTHLLAFGEYIPFGNIWPQLYDWIPASHFSIGPGPQVKDLPLTPYADGTPRAANVKFGPQICYEGLFAFFARDLADQGAEIFVNVTNDSWYGTWQQPYQHLYNTLGRAIEFRRPLIRATNTGITTVVTALGEVMDFSPLHAEWAHVYQVPYRQSPSQTIYQKYPWLMTTLLIITLLWICIRPTLRKRQT